ncbi:MAG: glycosyltransferase [Phycisphaeraceae bacterium]|nr:glycosyltransferase [Phycisphaeraceae bacterium]
MSELTLIFAGGGTGGHLFPGLAIAEAARTFAGHDKTNLRCLFLCSNRPLDSTILSAEGAEFVVMPARPLSLRPMGLVRFARAWGPSVRLGRQTIRRERDAGRVVRVVAMGGFVAAPIAQAARAEQTPVTLVNLDAVPGKANRWIGRRADAGVFSALPVQHEAARRWTVVPPIVRSAAVAKGEQSECRARLGIDPSLRTLMVTGGSQGARTINDLLAGFARDHAKDLAGWQVIHQCGKDGAATVREAYAAAGVPAIVHEFVSGMADWWGAADLAVSRSGAGSVAEAWANAVPTLFMPYPYHRDEHQRFNAMPLVDAGGAVLAVDRIELAVNAAEVGPQLAGLINDPSRLDSMRAALRSLGPADGAERIARALLEPAASTTTR